MKVALMHLANAAYLLAVVGVVLGLAWLALATFQPL
jgi:hypothetical protein